MKSMMLIASLLLLSACNTPSRIGLPDDRAQIEASQAAGRALAGKPLPPERIRAGDTLRIVRNSGEAPSISAFTANSIYELTLFQVLNDGTFSYPYIGTVKAAGLTLPQLNNLLESKLQNVYRETALTINISQSPGNTVFVGGAVRNSVTLSTSIATSLEQAIVGAGGVALDADAGQVALLRQEENGLYKTYLFDYSKFLWAGAGGPTAPVLLKRGDIVFVPKSSVGNKVDGVSLYFNQLIPFAKSIGLGLNYELRNNN
ncbi:MULTISPECIES: polysaccharide biosynthesis/export family protein [Pseudomonas syringae group]|uniref:Polysaccharide biosynthesis/export protein n=2 Tax=Pseudomonas syringae group TaxID=136849 RepID=A0A0N8QX13_PSECA|nr:MULTISPECIES: polysaccharide biosynthesis/export family protein [Pseudomonas syringae group]KAA8708989.1 polysaccharide export protein [Pseudomonas cannabina]KPW71510.1 Polysaccharide biosynthesis/export protein [Pseudomonas cannabina]RMN42703.1 Polysaccharide biosynthesis/export protein [Pseudomonas cannabina]RMO91589.1 Polysaccharide biosynthesis/export protein [Pseudomonas syringae pv. philadelphi]SDQ73043.1 protein involved in polysaccharide export, contains SLBB domain of the beta-gras